MKIISLLAAAAFAFSLSSLAPSTAHAEGLYGKLSVGQVLGASAGGASLNDDLAFGVAAGMDMNAFGVPVRVEAGYNRLNANLPPLEGSANDFYATAFFDVPVSERLSAYVGAGPDYVDATASLSGSEKNAQQYGWHATAGGAYRLNDRTTLEAQVTRLEANGLDFGSCLDDVDLEGYVATVGVRLVL